VPGGISLFPKIISPTLIKGIMKKKKNKTKITKCIFCRIINVKCKTNNKYICYECKKDIELIKEKNKTTWVEAEKQYSKIWKKRKTKKKKPKNKQSNNYTKHKYAGYLKSKHWLSKRKEFYSSKYSHGCCEVCGCDENLQIHHKSYKKLHNEPLSDLCCLCGDCHLTVHSILKHIIKFNVRSSGITLKNCHVKLKNLYVDVFGVEDAKQKLLDKIENT